jgi:hypothetical protein
VFCMQCDKETRRVIEVATNKRDCVLCEVRDETKETIHVIKVATNKRDCVHCEVGDEAKNNSRY